MKRSTTMEPIDALRAFECFHSLSQDELLVLAGRTTVEWLPEKETLFSRGDEDSAVILLLEGSVELAAGDDRSHRIDAGTSAAVQPLARLLPRRFTALTRTPSLVVRIDGSGLGDWQAALQHVRRGVEDAQEESLLEILHQGIEVEEFSDEDFLLDTPEAPMERHRLRIERGELELPSLSTVALEATRIIDRDEVDLDTLAQMLMNDPAITTKIIRAANSPLFYGHQAVDSCQRAIGRLGLRTTRQLVLAFAMREVFRTEARELEGILAALWEHSTKVAAISHVLARRVDGFEPGEAQLAGLLHSVGAIPVISYAASDPDLHADPQSVALLASRLRASLGMRMLNEWGFPAVLVQVVGSSDDWWRDESDLPDLVDLVLVARGLSLIGTPRSGQLPPLPRLPAFRKLTQGRIDARGVLALMDEAEDQIREIRDLLS